MSDILKEQVIAALKAQGHADNYIRRILTSMGLGRQRRPPAANEPFFKDDVRVAVPGAAYGSALGGPPRIFHVEDMPAMRAAVEW